MTQETINQILKFRDDRDWKQFHNPKDLAISISLEAAELLEVFQWSGSDTSCERKQDKIKEELADVINYCVLMADACGLDIDEIVQEKIRINNEKYPIEKAKGKSDKYIVFVYEDERPEAHADNEVTDDTVNMQIQLITPKEFDYFKLKKKIRDLLEGADFFVTSIRSFLGDVYVGTEKTRQTVFEVTYTESRKTEE